LWSVICHGYQVTGFQIFWKECSSTCVGKLLIILWDYIIHETLTQSRTPSAILTLSRRHQKWNNRIQPDMSVLDTNMCRTPNALLIWSVVATILHCMIEIADKFNVKNLRDLYIAYGYHLTSDMMILAKLFSWKSNMEQFTASRLTMLAWLSKIELPHQKGESFLLNVEINFFPNSTCSGHWSAAVL